MTALLSAREFAARAGLTPRQVQRLCASGMIRAVRLGGPPGTWAIAERELDAPHFTGRRRKAPGWPPGKRRGPRRPRLDAAAAGGRIGDAAS